VPAVGGTEGVGIVVSVAPGVSKLKVNDWVIPSHPHIGVSIPFVAIFDSECSNSC
jgi:NADPH:quinone reductase-like Zn-dependent oxidoreductase